MLGVSGEEKAISNPRIRNHPKKQLLTGTVTLKCITGNNLSDQYLPRNRQTKRKRREVSRICKDLLDKYKVKMICEDQVTELHKYSGEAKEP